MLMHAISNGGCTDTMKESALEVDWEKNPSLHQGLEPESVLRLAFQSDFLPTDLFLTPRFVEDSIPINSILSPRFV